MDGFVAENRAPGCQEAVVEPQATDWHKAAAGTRLYVRLPLLRARIHYSSTRRDGCSDFDCDYCHGFAGNCFGALARSEAARRSE